MVDSRNETHRVDEDLPGVALAAKDVSAFARERVEAAPALAGLLHPPALEPAAFFESVQQRIERGDVELQPAGRARLDELADLVSVAGSGLDDRKDDQLRGPLLQLAVQHSGVNSCHSHICYRHANRRASAWGNSSRRF